MIPGKFNPVVFKTVLFYTLKEFDEWWLENGTEIEFDGKPELVKASLLDFMNWLERQLKPYEDGSVEIKEEADVK